MDAEQVLQAVESGHRSRPEGRSHKKRPKGNAAPGLGILEAPTKSF
jgi:hypothetical protein